MSASDPKHNSESKTVQQENRNRKKSEDPFFWIVFGSAIVVVFLMLSLTGFGMYVAIFKSDDLEKMPLSIRLMQSLVGMHFGLFIVMLGAFWAWFEVTSTDNVELRMKLLSGKFFGVSTPLIICGTLIILATLYKDFQVTIHEFNMPEMKRSQPTGSVNSMERPNVNEF